MVSHLNIFVWKWSKIAAQKKMVFVLTKLALCATFCVFTVLNVFLLPFTNVESQIGRLQKDSLGKSKKTRFWSQMLKFLLRNGRKSPRGKKFFWGLCNSLLMELGQGQLCNHPTVDNGGVNRGRVCG